MLIRSTTNTTQGRQSFRNSNPHFHTQTLPASLPSLRLTRCCSSVSAAACWAQCHPPLSPDRPGPAGRPRPVGDTGPRTSGPTNQCCETPSERDTQENAHCRTKAATEASFVDAVRSGACRLPAASSLFIFLKSLQGLSAVLFSTNSAVCIPAHLSTDRIVSSTLNNVQSGS